MAITAALVASGEGESTADATSYQTLSVSPPSNQLLLLAVGSGCTTSGGADTDPSSVTGLGLTWVLVDGQQQASGTPGNQRVSVFRAMGTVTAGQITINYSEQQHNCSWRLIAFDGVDTSGTNGSGAIGVKGKNTATGPGTQPSVTLSGMSSGSATYSAVIGNSTSNVFTPGSGFTEYGNQENTNPATPSTRMACEFSATGTNPVNWTVSATTQYGIVAIEIKELGIVTKSGSDTLNFDENESATGTSTGTATDTLAFDENETQQSTVSFGAGYGGYEEGYQGGALNYAATETSATTAHVYGGPYPDYELGYEGPSEFLNFAVTETSTISDSKSGSDTLNFDENESGSVSVISESKTGADTLNFDENESSATTAQRAVTDNLNFDENEAGSVSGTVTAADTIAFDENEVSALTITKTGTDTIGFDENESSSLQQCTTITYPATDVYPSECTWPYAETPGGPGTSADTLGFAVTEAGSLLDLSVEEYWGVPF